MKMRLKDICRADWWVLRAGVATAGPGMPRFAYLVTAHRCMGKELAVWHGGQQ